MEMADTPTITVIGDPVRDIHTYIESNYGYREVVHRLDNPGAAKTSFYTVTRLLKNGQARINVKPGFSLAGVVYTVYRNHHSTFIDEYREAPNPGMPPERTYFTQPITAPLFCSRYKAEKNALLINDVNKGYVNKLNIHKVVPPAVDLAVVDAKYRSTNLNLIHNAKIKIWRCTKDEYNADWAENFDWVIRTNHGGSVTVLEGAMNAHITLSKAKHVECTFGAGDVFTAALTSFLFLRQLHTNEDNFTMDDMSRAIEFSHQVALEAIALPGTQPIKTAALKEKHVHY